MSVLCADLAPRGTHPEVACLLSTSGIPTDDMLMEPISDNILYLSYVSVLKL